MSNRIEDVDKFIYQCRTLIPEFMTKIHSQSKIMINEKETYNFLSYFLEEYKKFSNNLNTSGLDSNFINFFFNKQLLERYSNYSQEKIIRVQSLINHFINFLTLKKVLKNNLTINILSELHGKSELKKGMEVRISSQIHKILNQIGKEIFDFSKKANVEKLDNKIIDSFLKKMENYPEKLIVKAIFKLFEEIEDENSFIKVLYILDNFLKLNTLPSKTIDYLRFKAKKERTLFRLLLLYQSFYFAGYKLEKSILDVLKELEIESPAVNELFEKSANYIESLSHVDLFHEPIPDNFDIFNVEKIIDEIKPLSHNSPIFDNRGTVGYNLPKNIDLKIYELIHQLDEIYQSPSMKKEFLSAFSEDFTYNSLAKDNMLLFFEAKELHIKGKNKKALVLINRVLKKHPNFAPGLILKGEILSELHQFHGAIKCYLKSIKINPYRFHAYSYLSYTLQIGGYFYSSFILSNLLIKFFPFDFIFNIQLAFSAYQLLKPFKIYLKIAGLLEPERLVNFLDRFWIRERIEAKDNLIDLKLEKNEFLEIEKSVIKNSNNILNFLMYYNNSIQKYDFNNEFNEIIGEPLYFFPEKIDHTKKNHFIYEYATDLATNLVELVEDLSPTSECFFLNEEFLKFCFKISQEITDKILKWNLKINNSKKTRSLDLVISKKWIEDSLKSLIKEPYFILIKALIPSYDFYDTIQTTLNELFTDCFNCSHMCVIYSTDIFPDFKESCSEWNEFNEEKYENEVNFKRSKFEQDFIPILGLFEIYLREKALSEKTIEDKIGDNLEFLKFIFFNLDTQSNDFRTEINDEILKIFLKKHIIDKKLVQSKTAMQRVQRSLNTFLGFLSNELSYFSNDRLRSLRETIKKVKFLY